MRKEGLVMFLLQFNLIQGKVCVCVECACSEPTSTSLSFVERTWNDSHSISIDFIGVGWNGMRRPVRELGTN